MKNYKLLLIFLLALNLFGKDLKPQYSFVASGGVSDLVLNQEKLLAATTSSSVDIFNINTKEMLNSIKVPKIKDFMGDTIHAKVYSTDMINDKILVLSQGQSGGRNIFIYEDEKLVNLINDEERLFIAYAKFIDENHIIYALLSNQVYLFDIKNKKVLKEIQVSQSKFSHFRLNEDKTQFLVSDESGVLNLFDSRSFNKIKTFKGQNVDNVFQVDIKNNTIISAGQDRRAAVYYTNSKSPYYMSTNFLIYSVALSSSAKRGAFSCDEENNAMVFDTNTKQELFKLTNNKNILSNILFLNEDEIYVASDDENINYYNLK